MKPRRPCHVLLALAALAAQGAGARAQEAHDERVEDAAQPGAEGALESNPVLARRPHELPRAPDGRWKAFAAGASAGGGLSEAVAGALDEATELYARDDYPAALARVWALLEAEPDVPPGWLVLGTVYFRLRRYEDARYALERFLELAPDDLWRTQALAHCYYSLGDYERATEHYTAILATGVPSVEVLRGLALSALARGDEERALGLLRSVIEREPGHAEAHRVVARILFDQDRLDEAWAFVARARELAPFDPRTWYLATRLAFAREDEDEARQSEARWRELDPLVQELRSVEAKLRWSPTSFGLHVRRVELLAEIGDGRALEQAASGFLATRPAEVAALECELFVLDALVATGREEGARRAAKRIEARFPEESEAWARLERFYAGLRDRPAQVRAGERRRRLEQR